jgi:glutamate synthase domain-containing protein 2
MKVFISVVPPGGGEILQSVDVELEAMTQPGDYISIGNSAGGGTEDFIVRRCLWNLNKTNQEDGITELEQAIVIAEMAYGPFSSESHKATIQAYEAAGKTAQSFESTTS